MKKGDIIWNNESVRIVYSGVAGNPYVEYHDGFDATGEARWKEPTETHEYKQVVMTLGCKLAAVLKMLEGKK